MSLFLLKGVMKRGQRGCRLSRRG